MGEILEITVWMWFVAVASFAPLGYFIYLFTKGNGESFGKSNPADHSVEHKKYYQVINSVLGKILGGGSVAKSPQRVSNSASTARSTAARKSATKR